MSDILIPIVGILATLLGLMFLVGCFVRVDSQRFLERAGGDPSKIHRLETLQDAWSTIGKLRQFVASSAALLIFGVGLLAVWGNPALGKYYWVVPAILLANLGLILLVRRDAVRSLNPLLPGHAEVLKVLKQSIRMCISFSVVFLVLVARG
ncbi:hypothetical protein [Agrilutibacter solisilvae]|uniref:Uncharacterized protein n=1 Tax=Agrilutibacter solisilvae TaxID=2763317 RepID=A0A974Y1H5_9GAMM|nr:hypothetical protein [Lysobacter solisilvae]QSX79716.1 hypothetical protein I8J32_007730 [Lysobacter solisilvae]